MGFLVADASARDLRGRSGEAEEEGDLSDRFLLTGNFSGSGERRRCFDVFSAEGDLSTRRRLETGDGSTRRGAGGDELEGRRRRGGGGGGGDETRSFRRSLLRGGDGSERRRRSLGDGERLSLLVRGEGGRPSCWRRLRGGEAEREYSFLFLLGEGDCDCSLFLRLGEGERESPLLLRLGDGEETLRRLLRSCGESLRSRSFLRSLGGATAGFFCSGDHSPSEEDADGVGECLRYRRLVIFFDFGNGGDFSSFSSFCSFSSSFTSGGGGDGDEDEGDGCLTGDCCCSSCFLYADRWWVGGGAGDAAGLFTSALASFSFSFSFSCSLSRSFSFFSVRGGGAAGGVAERDRDDCEVKLAERERDESDAERERRRGEKDGDRRGFRRGETDGDRRGFRRGETDGDRRGFRRGETDGDRRSFRRGETDGDRRGFRRGDRERDLEARKTSPCYRNKYKYMYDTLQPVITPTSHKALSMMAFVHFLAIPFIRRRTPANSAVYSPNYHRQLFPKIRPIFTIFLEVCLPDPRRKTLK